MDGKIMFIKKYISKIVSIICALGSVGIAKAQSPPYITITPTPFVSPLPTTTFGKAMDNLTDSHFNLLYFPSDALSPYGFTVMGNLSIPAFLIFLFIYLGMWLSTSNLRLASITGLLLSGAFLFSGGIGVSMPVVIQPLAFGALLASVVGITMSMFKNIG
jgi:hypothetical protein